MGYVNHTRHGCMPRRYPSPYTNPTPCCPAAPPTPTTAEQCADMVVAMAYVPWQQLDTVYEAENGYPRGTIFPELDKPWMAGGTYCG